MNNQIKALMSQTLDEKFSGTWSTMDMQDLQKFAERFSELIVIKCLDIVDKKVSGMVGVAAMKEIEEHFGVKE